MFKEEETFKANRNVASRCLWAIELTEPQRLTGSENLTLLLIKWSETGSAAIWNLAVKTERLHVCTYSFVQCCYLKSYFWSMSKFESRRECTDYRFLALPLWCNFPMRCSLPFHLGTFGLKMNVLNILVIAKWSGPLLGRSMATAYWGSLLRKFHISHVFVHWFVK